MSIFAFIKNGRKQRVNMMPSAYPSSRVTYGNSNAEVKLDSLTTDVSGKVSKSGDTMSGTLNMNTENNVALNFRPNHSEWSTTVSYQNSGDEALVFATKQNATSMIFASGEDSITNHSADRWKSLTRPALQIKNNKVAIGVLVANGATPKAELTLRGCLYQSGKTDCNGNGSYNYFKIATLTITGANVNTPIIFELMSRGSYYTRVDVKFLNSGGTDPDLDYLLCSGGNYRRYFIKKVATSTWELYGQHDGVWGRERLLRVAGMDLEDGINIDINMSNVSSLPSGYTQARWDLPTNSIVGGATGYTPSNEYFGTWSQIGTVGSTVLYRRTS